MHIHGEESVERVFKQKINQKYVQVKSALINRGEEIIVICTDITGIKSAEKQAKKIRSTFFSSVAHELRTPLNSIIPIIKMILDPARLQ